MAHDHDATPIGKKWGVEAPKKRAERSVVPYWPRPPRQYGQGLVVVLLPPLGGEGLVLPIWAKVVSAIRALRGSATLSRRESCVFNAPIQVEVG